MRLTVLVALLLVVLGCYLMLGSAREMADDVAMSAGQRAAAGTAPHVLNPESVPYLHGYAGITVRCDAEDACDGEAKLISRRTGELLGTIEYFVKPGQPARLMIPAMRPERAILHWRARNGVVAQTEITLQRH
jgi:hypothetical protein